MNDDELTAFLIQELIELKAMWAKVFERLESNKKGNDMELKVTRKDNTNPMMYMKVRKQPATVEAFEYTGDPLALAAWMTHMDDVAKFGVTREGVFLETLEGRMKASEGDIIIRGVDGEYYPCKPHIFDMTYDVLQHLDIL